MPGLGSQILFPNNHPLAVEGQIPLAHVNCLRTTVSRLNITSGSQSCLPLSATKRQGKSVQVVLSEGHLSPALLHSDYGVCNSFQG